MIFFSPIKTPTGPRWFVVFLVACVASATIDEMIYAKLGDEVTLKPKPGSVTRETNIINWKAGGELSVIVHDGILTGYRYAKRANYLNIQTGELTITGLTYEDSKVYTTEIDNVLTNYNIHLHVISPVPEPTITSSCTPELSTCTLTCEGNTTRAGPVTYTWMSDSVVVPHYTNTYDIMKEDSSDVKEFKCKIKNPVSEETSSHFFNPLKPATIDEIYAKLGDEVTLKPKPGSVTHETKRITWKVGGDDAMEMAGGLLISYTHFMERGHMNYRTGEMTITGLTYKDTQVYTTEIDGAVVNHNIHLRVISPVPEPTINSSCTPELSTCTLTCEGNTTRAGPVNYTWTSDSVVVTHYTDTYDIMKEDSSDVKEFKCKMKNPVSEETSSPFFNPLNPDSTKSSPKIYAGFKVFAILLVPVLLLVIFYGLKTGDENFWRNTKGHSAAEYNNNNTTPPPNEQTEEQTAMTAV